MVLDVDPQKRRISLGLKQGMANPWEAFAEKHPGRHRARGRGPQHHRVRPVRRPARRHRRHGPPVRPRLGQAGEEAIKRLQQGRHGQGQGARRRRREGAHLARHQAARRRPVRAGERRSPRRATWSPCIVHGRSRTTASRSTVQRRRPGLHPQVRARPRPRRAAPRPLRRRREARRQGHQHRHGHAPASCCRSRRARSTRRSRRWPNSARPTRGASLGDILGAALSRAQKKDEDEEK